VKREAFSPPPKVDSAILAITNINRKRVPRQLEKKYFAIVKAGLGSRRKMLFGNLVRVFPEAKEEIERVFSKLAIERNIRGEDLSFELWLTLVRSLDTVR
jgi:16S rRNA (adenine1518-N6/adenine1519-N6)-dimethyltransferase